jgi:hypothetical protein
VCVCVCVCVYVCVCVCAATCFDSISKRSTDQKILTYLLTYLQQYSCLGRAHERAQRPLVLDLLLIHGSEFDLIQAHLEAWTDLLELDLLAVLLVHMVAERDVVIDVGIRHDTLAIVLGHREQVLEDIGHLHKHVDELLNLYKLLCLTAGC